jgi:hypothetical protein
MAADLERDCFLVGKANRLGVIGSDGTVRTPVKYRAAGRWNDSGHLWVSGHGDPPLDGNFVNSKGFEISAVPVGLREGALGFEVPAFTNGRAAVRIGEKAHGFVSPEGKILFATSVAGAAMHHLDDWLVIREADRVGFANVAGRVVIPARFDDARPFQAELAPVREGVRWGLVRRDGTYAFRPMYDEIRLLTRHGDRPVLWEVRLDDRWGVADSNGGVLVPPRFDSIRDSAYGVATVTMEQKFAVIEVASNRILTPPRYDNAMPPDPEGVWLRREGKWGRAGLGGHEQAPFNVDRVWRLGENHWQIWRDGRSGVISDSGEEVVTVIYSDVSSVTKNLVRVRDAHKFGLFDLCARKLLLKPEYERVRVYSQFRERIALVKLEGRWGVVDLISGEPIVPIESDALDPWWPSLLVASKGDRQALYSYTGEEVLAWDAGVERIAGTHEFTHGFGKVKSGERTGLITSRGKIALPCRYEDVGTVSEGLVAVRVSGRWGHLRMDGAWCIEPAYEETHPFSNGFAAVRKNGRVGYIDQTGATVIPFRYDDAGCAHEGLFPVALQDPESGVMHWGLVNDESDIVLPLEYEALEWPYPGRSPKRIHGRPTWRSL